MTGVNRTYTNNIPFSTHNPSSDQPIMEQNTNSISAVLSVDHSAFNTSDLSGGYHSIIHQPVTLNSTTRSWDPVTRVFTPAVANTSGLNQIISANYTPNSTNVMTDTQLFNLTGNGGASQLTGNNATGEGYVWAGGLLFQWGTVTTGIFNNGSVTFKGRNADANSIPFPVACFGVVITANFAGTPTKSPAFSTGGVTKTGFNWFVVDDQQPQYPTFFWFAVGI